MTKAERQESIFELSGFIQVEATIECGMVWCKSILGGDDEDSVSEDAHANGWRVVDGNVVCKKCLRKMK